MPAVVTDGEGARSRLEALSGARPPVLSPQNAFTLGDAEEGVRKPEVPLLQGEQGWWKSLEGRRVVLSIVLYGLASSSMLLVNKALVDHVEAPGTVVSIQLAFTTGVVSLLTQNRVFGLEPVVWSWPVAKAYLLYTSLFVLGMFANMRALAQTGVETVIVFRACTPIAVAACDYLFMGREMPSQRSALALVALVMGSLAYVQSDMQFQLAGLMGYVWVTIWSLAIVAQMTLGKAILKNKGVSVSSAVLYNNGLAILPMLLFSIGAGENPLRFQIKDSTGGMLLITSCLVGTAIGYCGWWCRSLMSAAAYTVVGVSNKFLTIGVNRLVYPTSSGYGGLASVVFCVMASSMYRQSSLRQR